jgi:hypothetical protein
MEEGTASQLRHVFVSRPTMNWPSAKPPANGAWPGEQELSRLDAAIRKIDGLEKRC